MVVRPRAALLAHGDRTLVGVRGRATAPWLASATASDGIRHFGRGKYLKSRTGALARFVRTPDA